MDDCLVGGDQEEVINISSDNSRAAV